MWSNLFSSFRCWPIEQRFDLTLERDARCGVVHLGLEHDASLRVEEQRERRAVDAVILLRPRPVAFERHEADPHRGEQGQHRIALRRFEVDGEYGEAAARELLEDLLQVGKLPTAAR